MAVGKIVGFVPRNKWPRPACWVPRGAVSASRFICPTDTWRGWIAVGGVIVGKAATPITKNCRDYGLNCMNIQLWGVIEFGKDGGGDPRATQIRRRTEDIAIMTYSFFERPILNSPYAYPGGHWELDEDGQPTNRIIAARRAPS